MFTRNIAFVSLMAAFIAEPAFAEGQDGNFFLQACGATVKQANGGTLSPEEGAASLYCVGYVAGFLDGVSLATSQGGNGKVICTPERGITNDQAIRIFVKYLRGNPKVLHESGRMSLFVALAKTFSCEK